MSAPITADLAVIGAGAAGSLAAVAAARAGARVVVIAGPPGATSLSSGAIDLAGGESELTATLESGVDLLASRRPLHPLTRLGRDEVSRVAGAVAEALADAGPLYVARSLDRPPKQAVSALGRVHRAWMAQATQVDLRLLTGGTVGLAELGSSTPVSSWLLRPTLEAEVRALGLDIELVEVEATLPTELDRVKPLLLARSLDRRRRERQLLGRVLKEAVKGKDLAALLIPPLAGLDRAPEVTSALSEAVGAPVYELLGRPGDPPGMRLHRLLEQMVAKAGAEVIRGQARAARIEADRVTSLELGKEASEATVVKAGAFVLATGGLAGGGLELGRTLTEGVFGLQLSRDGRAYDPPASLTGADRSELFSARPGEPHPVASAGVPVDGELRPLRDGEPVLVNVRAAGAVLADHDPAVDGSGLGTALVTGWRAGELAADRH